MSVTLTYRMLITSNLMLSESSKEITTFACGDLGLFRYRRLFFGICSASELFQNTIAQVLSGIPGCRNAADNNLVAGRTLEEHNSTLHRVLQRLQDSGLTLNKKKCSLMQTELDFWGTHLSQEGISVSPSRVQALSQLKRPKNAAESRSLLGMTG
jgi:Reverse transcriptase (RNA-dependent DNA polymerase)